MNNQELKQIFKINNINFIHRSNYPAQGEQYHTQYEGDGQPYDNRR